MTGAITQAIEALKKVAGQSCAGRNPEGEPYLVEAYDALKAFKDGVPEYLEDAMKSFDALEEITVDDYCKKYESTPHYAQWKAATLLMDGVKQRP